MSVPSEYLSRQLLQWQGDPGAGPRFRTYSVRSPKGFPSDDAATVARFSVALRLCRKSTQLSLASRLGVVDDPRPRHRASWEQTMTRRELAFLCMGPAAGGASVDAQTDPTPARLSSQVIAWDSLPGGSR
jgi:hypothetical protein